MTTEWAHLPNAKYINDIIASLGTHNTVWLDASPCQPRDAAWEAALEAALEVAREGARPAVWAAAWEAAAAARPAARCAILALIAYDDCAYMLDSDPEEIRILAKLGDQRAILMQIGCIAYNKIKELQVV